MSAGMRWFTSLMVGATSMGLVLSLGGPPLAGFCLGLLVTTVITAITLTLSHNNGGAS